MVEILAMKRAVLLAILSVIGGIAAAPPVRAECIAFSVNVLKRQSALVMEGTVSTVGQVAEEAFVATVQVHRVWKGKASKQMPLYYIENHWDGPRLRVGDRYVFFALLQPPNHRERFGIPSDAAPTFFVPSCTGAMLPDEREVIKPLGRSRAPAQEP